TGRYGYDDLSTAGSVAKHPLLYNAVSPATSSGGFQFDLPFSMKDNLYYLIGSNSGTNYTRSVLNRLIPNNMTYGARRMLLTTHSYDLDVPGMSPSLYAGAGANAN